MNELTNSTDRIEKETTLAAPRRRVWRAITDVRAFNAWFGIELTAPFVPGTVVTGGFPNPKYAHVRATFWIEALEPDRYFSFRWHPYAIQEGVDYSAEPTTLIEFTLDEVEGGTRLTVVESGFDAIPEARRALAFEMDSKGWTAQLDNVRKYLERDVATA
jgi:uncharacterized protein YndB with AHSA1/START domain